MPQPKILIVEDEALIAEDLAFLLKRMRYEVVGAASSGKEAVAMAEATSPDLVLMDVTLQGAMDGIEAARRLREMRDIPVVYVTAHAGRIAEKFDHSEEPYSWVAKPFSPGQLHNAIENALARAAKCGIEKH